LQIAKRKSQIAGSSTVKGKHKGGSGGVVARVRSTVYAPRGRIGERAGRGGRYLDAGAPKDRPRCPRRDGQQINSGIRPSEPWGVYAASMRPVVWGNLGNGLLMFGRETGSRKGLLQRSGVRPSQSSRTIRLAATSSLFHFARLRFAVPLSRK
jgi:hypothetical protein